MKTKIAMTADTPPFPRLGEIYRVLALALDIKHESTTSGGLYRDIDRLAREGEYDWSLLPTLCQELIIKPLARHTDAGFAALVEQFVSHVHASYVHLVAAISLDSLSREQALPLLVTHYFSAYGCGLLFGIQKEFGGPDLLALLDAQNHPIGVVMDWASGDAETGQGVKTLIKTAFSDTTDEDKTGRDMMNRWVKGRQLPGMDNLYQFTKKLKTKGFAEHENLRRWLVVARAMAWLEEKSPVPLRNIMRQHFLLGLQDFDIGALLSHAVHNEGKKLSPLTMPALMLIENLKRTTPKLAGDKDKAKADLAALQRLVEQHDLEGRTRFHLEWLQGRWHVLSGEVEQALPYYKEAARLVNYRGGDTQKSITEEALVIAGYLGDRVFLKQLKHRAIAFGLFSRPREEDLVQDWEITQFRQQFHRIFPAQGRFPEVALAQIDVPELPFLVLNKETLYSIKPDLRNPERAFKVKFADGQARRWPQLGLFVFLGKAEEVARLLERGASVDTLDDSNCSALLCALQHAKFNGEREVLDLLLKQTHAKETLNRATDVKKRIPLICAIDYGEPDVVARLLEMGASADRRGHIDQLTSLYHCVGVMALLETPTKFYAYVYESLTSNPDLVRREVMRRYNVSFTGVFGDEAGLAELLKSPKNQALFSQLMQATVKEQNSRHTSVKLLQMVQLLLQHGANPNVPHAYPAKGRTPLMLAAENNSVPALNLMLKHGGDPYIKDADGKNCMKIAMDFSSHAVVDYLRTNGVR
jgi:hypothetical protein